MVIFECLSAVAWIVGVVFLVRGRRAGAMDDACVPHRYSGYLPESYRRAPAVSRR